MRQKNEHPDSFQSRIVHIRDNDPLQDFLKVYDHLHGPMEIELFAPLVKLVRPQGRSS